MVTYDGTDLYRGLENPFEGGRYHSLAIDPGTLPSELIVDAKSEDGEIMGLHHIEHATYGVQFHPESVLTEQGYRLLAQFLELAGLASAGPIPVLESRQPAGREAVDPTGHPITF